VIAIKSERELSFCEREFTNVSCGSKETVVKFVGRFISDRLQL
jgi:hypothetical protein